jgi:hypothetical protein
MLGVEKWNIKKIMGRWVQLDTIQNVFWIKPRQACCSYVLPKSIKNFIVDWWIKEIMIFPNRKDVVNKQIVVKQFDKHLKHFLQVSQVRWTTNICITFFYYCKNQIWYFHDFEHGLHVLTFHFKNQVSF